MRYQRVALSFFHGQERRVFLRRFSCTCRSVGEYKSVQSGLNLKIQNESYLSDPIVHFHEGPALGVDCGYSSLSVYLLPFALTIIIKDPFLVTCSDIFEKRVISLLWKKTCRYGYAIFLIDFAKSTKKSNEHLAHFSYLFQVMADSGLGCIEVEC